MKSVFIVLIVENTLVLFFELMIFQKNNVIIIILLGQVLIMKKSLFIVSMCSIVALSGCSLLRNRSPRSNKISSEETSYSQTSEISNSDSISQSSDITSQQSEIISSADEFDDAGTYNIKIWVDDKILDLTRTQIQRFVSESNGKYNIYATIEPQSEGTAASSMLQDAQSGADLFIFAQDQLSRLKVADALSILPDEYVTFVEENNSEDSVKAASLGDDIYAFPMTNDMGYFLYYDKNIISDDDAKSMSTILRRCRDSAKKLYFEARSNGFYSASYFLATGCHSNWTLDVNTGRFVGYDDNYCSEKGLIAAKGLRELADSSLVATNALASKLGSTAAAVVSGIWEYDIAEKRLGSNLGCAELPSFNVDGKDYHLSSFDGYKLLGVKPQADSKKASVCLKLARYLSSEICQTERFNEVNWGPTNNKSSQQDAVLNHPALAALAKQHEYATQQGQCPGAWYITLGMAARSIEYDSTDEQIRQILINYQNDLDDLLLED